MTRYLCKMEIDIWSDDHIDAAYQAMDIIKRSPGLIFEVSEYASDGGTRTIRTVDTQMVRKISRKPSARAKGTTNNRRKKGSKKA